MFLKRIVVLLAFALLIIGCGKEPDDLVFDNPNDPLSPVKLKNLLINGGFEQNSIAPWYTYSVSNSDIAAELTTEGAIEGKNCLHIKVLKKGLDIWNAGLEQPYVLEKNKVYTLSAYLKSPNNHKFNLSLLPSVEPFIAYAEMMISMTNTWQQYHITSQPMLQDAQSIAVFHFASDIGEFWVDDVKLYEGEYVP